MERSIVVRMERSAGSMRAVKLAPDCAALNLGYLLLAPSVEGNHGPYPLIALIPDGTGPRADIGGGASRLIEALLPMNPAAAGRKSGQQPALELDQRKHWRTSIVRRNTSAQRELGCYAVAAPVDSMPMRASIREAGENTLPIRLDKCGYGDNRRVSSIDSWTGAQSHVGWVNLRRRIMNHVWSGECGEHAR
jgi:hypothetical protein